jgi:excisionase family DNA binding protein
MRRSRSNQHDKVQRARAVVAQALGDAARRDGPQVEKFVPTTKAPEPPQPKNEAIGVLTVREAATRLGISISEMEAMVKRGAVKSLMAGWTVVVPTSEVERLRSKSV